MKKTITIMIAALLICTFAGCTAGTENTQTEASSGEVSVSAIAKKDNKTENEGSVTEGSSESNVTDDMTSSTGESHSSQAADQNTSESSSDTASQKITKDSAQRSSESTSDSNNSTSSSESTSDSNNSTSSTETNVAVFTSNSSGKIDTSDIFSNRDLTQSPDLTEAETIQATSNKTVTITEEGIYILTGTATNFTVRVEADKEAKVQLVLDNFNVTNSSTPVIYVVSADKCFVTTNGGTSTLSVTGSFTADGDTNTDAVIFSKDDLVLNGTGTLTITSSSGNGISGKDDIKITGGTYNITAAEDGVEAHDSIRICGGTFTIKAGKDGLHSENDEDDTVGWIYISDGDFSITASSDGIRGTTCTQIDGGTISISSSEGIESTYIQINGGNVSISANDDGINASQKSRSAGTPTFEMTGGSLTVTMSGGDVDCIDANGNIIVSGGTINVSYPVQGPSESFDYDGTATFTDGTIIINGTQVDSIPQGMMGGGMGGMNGMGGMRNMGGMDGRGGFSFG